MKYWSEDTIVAISTPRGRSAIGVVRMSGRRAVGIAESMFKGINGEKVSAYRSHTMHYGRLNREGKTIDRCLLCVMRQPLSYTGEDMVEMSCHGSPMILKKVVEACVMQGARLAQPGEYTKRAYLNGKMDLTQAEAVASLIEAKTENALSLALRQLSGELRERIVSARSALLDCAAELEASLDFPEEELNLVSKKEIMNGIKRQLGDCRQMINSYSQGRVVSEGVKVAIVGKMNVGKSSLFNRLLQSERAIVTDEEGTTTDVIEETLVAGGCQIVLSDSAGIGIGRGAAAEEGVRRSRKAIKGADFLIFVADRSQPWSVGDRDIARESAEKKGMLVVNKADLEKGMNPEDAPGEIADWPHVEVSALTGAGMDILEKMLGEAASAYCGGEEDEHLTITTLRHVEALKECCRELENTVRSSTEGCSEEILAEGVRRAVENLDELTGDTFGEELLERIFSRFCIGK